jgi:hypothetical protein
MQKESKPLRSSSAAFPSLTRAQDRRDAWPRGLYYVLCAKDGKVLAAHGGLIENFDEFLKEIRNLHGKL